MKALFWVAAGLCVAALAFNVGPDVRRYIKMSSM